jgi:hypothetical protein
VSACNILSGVAATWNSLEVAKLVVGVLIPAAIFSASVYIARQTQTYERWKWVRERIFEVRLQRWNEIAPRLNDLRSFFLLIGPFREIDPPRVIELKVELDAIVFANTHVFGRSFMTRYEDFMDACFERWVFANVTLRSSTTIQRRERGRWDDSWNVLFVPEERASEPQVVEDAYQALLSTFENLN